VVNTKSDNEKEITINSKSYEQEFNNLNNDLEEKARSAQDASKQLYASIYGHNDMFEEKTADEDAAIAAGKQEIIAETRKKLEVLSEDINNMIRERWDTSMSRTLSDNK
jgi:hypothetical protein